MNPALEALRGRRCSPILLDAVDGLAWRLSDEDRAAYLDPLLPLLPGTNQGMVREHAYLWALVGWETRRHAPAWLSASGQRREAAALAGLPEAVPGEAGRYLAQLVLTHQLVQPPCAACGKLHPPRISARAFIPTQLRSLATQIAGLGADATPEEARPRIVRLADLDLLQLLARLVRPTRAASLQPLDLH